MRQLGSESWMDGVCGGCIGCPNGFGARREGRAIGGSCGLAYILAHVGHNEKGGGTASLPSTMRRLVAI